MAKLDVTLNEEYFGVQPNVPLMHQVVTAQLAKRRAGTQSTKTRSEVRGGGAKPFRQKGTGRARQGSTNAPHYAGGGVALGPKPRSYAQRTPKKMIKLALRSALSDRAAADKVLVVDAFGWAEPSTKQAVKALDRLGVAGRTLVVLEREDAIAALSFRNLPAVQLINVGELNAYDVLCNDWVVFTQGSLSALTGGEGGAESLSDAEASDAELTDDEEAPTASAPDRSADEATGARAPASSRRQRPLRPPTAAPTRPRPSEEAPGRQDASAASPPDEADEPDASDRSKHHEGSRDIILAPVVSEKSYALMETGVYTFKVLPSASKPEIRDAVETIWDVEVTKVNTLNRKGKKRRTRGTNRIGQKSDVKHAIVTLASGEIPLFEN